MKAVLLAGGLGTRLAPYTAVLPKPLMPIGDKPILDIVIRQLKHQGVKEVILAVNHMAELLMSYFGDGERIGLPIQYSREEKPLGTAGPLGLLQNIEDSFIVMNGDILTNLNFSNLVDNHHASNSIATMGVCRRIVETDLGVVEFDVNDVLTSYLEKPTYEHWVSMGIYVFQPRVLEFIQPGQHLDLPDLMNMLISSGETINCFRHEGYWLDIGRLEDYEKAQSDFNNSENDLAL